jgi:2-methylcitrate dehydratase PrpD
LNNPATTALASHIASAEARGLQPDVLDRTKQHLLDSLVAMLSGATLRPGQLAIAYASSRGGIGESTVVGGPRTNAELAAFANAISAHADETDDVNNRARIHPGSSIVPAAVSLAEAYDRPGSALLTAVSLGYDIACAVNIGAWKTFHAMQQSARTSHGVGQTFGAAAAAASLAQLTMEQTRHVLSYAAQQVAGIATMYRDPGHIGKAFTTSAMQAHSGVRAVELVRSGFTAVDDIFDVKPSAFDAIGEGGDVSRVLHDLETTRHVTTTDIKQYPVGGPIQAAVQALTGLMNAHGLRAGDVTSIEVRLPTQGAYIVDNRTMPDICLQYILSVLLLDGRITFASSHDYERYQSAPVRDIMARIRAVPDATLDVAIDDTNLRSRRTWRAIVAVNTRDGQTMRERVDTPRGTHENPMSWDDLTTKAFMVLEDVMSSDRIEDLVRWVRNVETAASARELRRFMETPRSSARPRTPA